jgi:hypothetical protein
LERKLSEQTGGTGKSSLQALSAKVNWPILRKFETLVFACMLALLPFFAMKVVGVTETQLMVKNTTNDLVTDLRKARQMAKDHAVGIIVIGRAASKLNPPAYLIEDKRRMIEEIVLPSGVTVEGSVEFNPSGLPLKPSRFFIKKGVRESQVAIDERGVISAP